MNQALKLPSPPTQSPGSLPFQALSPVAMDEDYVFSKYSHYFGAYSAEFSKVNSVRCIVEIGVAGGGSLHYWKRQYPAAQVFGIDVDPLCKNCETDGIKVFIGDQSHKSFMEEVAAQIPKPDIVIDDGGHWPFMQRRSLAILWPRLNLGGCYCVEDLHTSYFKAWGGMFGGFIKDAKSHVDDLNRNWHKRPIKLQGLVEMVFRDSMVFFHKRIEEVPRLVTHGSLDCRGPKAAISAALPMLKFRIRRAVTAAKAALSAKSPALRSI